jgi:hypothetical protein
MEELRAEQLVVRVRGRGRPTAHKPADVCTFTRLRPELREFLEKEAHRRGWSLSAEIAMRVERSLSLDPVAA